MRKITFIGTGHGMPRQSLSSSLLIECDEHKLLVDVSDGGGVSRNLIQAGVEPSSIDSVFITHSDSDHITGIINLIRWFSRDVRPRKIYGLAPTLESAKTIIEAVESRALGKLGDSIEFTEVKEGDEITIGNMNVKILYHRNSKTPQAGLLAIFPDGYKLAVIGDEPIKENFKNIIKDVDLLIHEAFCLDSEIEMHDPHSKHHVTAKEAAVLAKEINAKKLALWHMEDQTLETRKQIYFDEVKTAYDGNVFIPIDGDSFEL